MNQEKGLQMSFLEPLPLRNKLGVSLFQIGSTLLRQMFLVGLLIFYREQLLLSEVYIIYAFALYALWNAINDPLFGILSDKTKTKWGRRRPYLWIFTPIQALAFLLLWISPSTAEIGQVGVFIWLLVGLLLFDTALTATTIVWSAVLPELTMIPKDRAELAFYATIFAMIAAIVVMFIPDVFLNAGTEGRFTIILILIIIQLVTMGISSYFAKERLVFQEDESLGVVDAIKYTIKNKSFLVTTSMCFLTTFNNTVFYGVIFFYLYYVHPGTDLGPLMIFVILEVVIGLIIGTIYAIYNIKKKGLKPAILRGLLFYAAGFFMIGLLPGIFGLLGFVVVGLGVFSSQSLVGTALADVSDEDEVITGRRREAAIYGTNALFTKPAESVGTSFIAFMLLAFHYQEPIGGVQQVQSSLAILGLLITLGIIPGIVAVLAFLVFRLFPLKGEYLKEIKTKMNEMHEEKLKQFIKKRTEQKG